MLSIWIRVQNFMFCLLFHVEMSLTSFVQEELKNRIHYKIQINFSRMLIEMLSFLDFYECYVVFLWNECHYNEHAIKHYCNDLWATSIEHENWCDVQYFFGGIFVLLFFWTSTSNNNNNIEQPNSKTSTIIQLSIGHIEQYQSLVLLQLICKHKCAP